MNLKQLVSISFALILCLQCTAQNNSYAIDIKSGSESSEIRQLMHFLAIERNKVILSAPDIAGKKVDLSYVEYTNGKASKEQVLTRGLPDNFYGANGSDTSFEFTLLSGEEDTSIHMEFVYPRFSIDVNFERRVKKGYSMRTIDYSNGTYTYNKKTPLFTFALPYTVKDDNKGNTESSYCQLTYDGVPPEQWYEKYGVEHYIIFYLTVVDKK